MKLKNKKGGSVHCRRTNTAPRYARILRCTRALPLAQGLRCPLLACSLANPCAAPALQPLHPGRGTHAQPATPRTRRGAHHLPKVLGHERGACAVGGPWAGQPLVQKHRPVSVSHSKFCFSNKQKKENLSEAHAERVRVRHFDAARLCILLRRGRQGTWHIRTPLLCRIVGPD